MEFYASIAAGVCTICLGFETDPVQSSDPVNGFTPDSFNFSGISEEVMNGFRWNFMHR